MWLCVFIELLSVGQCIGGIMNGVGSSLFAKTAAVMAKSKFQHTTATIWFVCAGIGDIVIAVCMTYLLFRKKPASWRLSSFLVKFIRLTVETNVLTAGIAITSLITFAYATSILIPIYLTFAMIMGKVYTNSLLVLLNSRIDLNKNDGGREGITFRVGTSESSGAFEGNKSARFSVPLRSVVHKEEIVEVLA